jgi:NitT/TauT family transport system ATP-binding protein
MLAVVVVLGAVALVGDRLLIALWDGMGWLRAQWAARKVQKLLASLPANPHTPTRGELQALHVRGLSAVYPNKPIISNVSLSVPAGHTLAIVGPSGCGKTTLLHAIAGMRTDGLHVTGEVTLGSKKIARGDIGAVIHDPLRFGDLTTWEYSMLGIQNPTHEDLLRNRDRLEAFGLLQDAHRPVRDLSKGQQQRADIAKALASQPKLLLMDEPFGALDDITRSELHTFFWDHVRGRSTIIFVTHNIREAIYLGDSVQVGVDANAFTLDTRSSESPEERMSPDERSLLAAIRKLKNGRHS